MKRINRNQIIIIIVAVVVGLLLGKLFFSGSHSEHNHEHHSHENAKETIWTCSMHPDIRQYEFGLCPLCGMDLIPLEDDDDSADDLTIKMSETAMKLANIHTAKIQKGDVKREIKLNGKIEADERLINSQSSHISGRIESLNINFTGEYVQKGKTIATIYSPELVTAQKELLETFKTKDDNEELFQATKQKLKRWKLSEKAINNIIETNNIVEIFPISADVSGYITKKNVNLGDYINRGDALFEIAELSKVWVLFELYEDDMQWVKTGDEIKYNVKSLPGETFSGKVTYIDPIIDPTTRIAKVRVEQENKNQFLKPEMYVSGVVESTLSKYENALSVPHSAVLWTGKRSIVYVKVESEDRVAFQLREVILGPSLGESYTIIEGLEEGEEIAVNGTFSIDAAAQLAGKYSMMSYENMTNDDSDDSVQFELHPDHTVSIPAKAEKAFLKVVEDYYKFKDALVNDDLNSAQKFGEALINSVKKTDMKLFTGESHDVWMSFYSIALENLEHVHHFDDIATIRKHFNPISHSLILTLNSFEMQSTTPIYIQYCPMVDDDTGAYWVSGEENVLNPYFGSMMLRCGEVTEVLNQESNLSINETDDLKLHPDKTVAIPAKAEKALLKVVEEYYKFKDALVNDDLNSAQKFGEALNNSVKKTDMKLFTGESHDVWMNFYSVALENLEHIHHFDDIATIRKHFNPISHTLILTLNSFEMQSTTPIYIQYCPMVDDDTGAYWVSGEENVLNPYFGSMMLRCGEVTEVLNQN